MKMRDIPAKEITNTVRRLCIEAAMFLEEDVLHAYRVALKNEKSPVARDILNQILENARIAKEENMPLCQDTGLAVVFLEIGQDVHIVGDDLTDAVNEGVRLGYRDGYLRASSCDPLTRNNFGDNTPAIIHVEIVAGDRIKISLAPKGFGSENMSSVQLFPPAMGIDGVKRHILERIEEAGPNPCPPIVLGIGIGGTFEKAALIAKKSLLRPLGQRNPVPRIAEIEQEILDEVNRLGIGPMGLGGTVTALDVHIETYPTHIASIPVAVNIQCHCGRHKEAIL